MVRLFVLGFLYLNITASFIVSGTVGADETIDTNTTDCVIITRKTPTSFSPDEIFVTPRAFPQFNSFFQDERFWTSKNTPLSSKAFKISYPKIDLKYIDTTLVNNHFQNMLSNKLVLSDVTRLSNQLLKIYGLKNRSGLPMSFNLVYDYDNAVLHKALFSFLSIINTPNPKAKEYEWKAQSFVKVFSQLCSSLNIGEEEDAELNLRIRQMIAISLGLSPLNYGELFKKEYPDLTKWIRNCARNKSRNPLATFTLSLMHALTPKVHAPLSQQIAIRTRITQHCPMPTSEQKQVTPPKAQAPQAAVSSVTPSQPVILCPTPKRNGSTLQSARQVLKNFNF
ncbi:MAG: hypothetical protein WCJ92_02795 [Alphaproteobacteria bacterium]